LAGMRYDAANAEESCRGGGTHVMAPREGRISFVEHLGMTVCAHGGLSALG